MGIEGGVRKEEEEGFEGNRERKRTRVERGEGV